MRVSVSISYFLSVLLRAVKRGERDTSFRAVCASLSFLLNCSLSRAFGGFKALALSEHIYFTC